MSALMNYQSEFELNLKSSSNFLYIFVYIKHLNVKI